METVVPLCCFAAKLRQRSCGGIRDARWTKRKAAGEGWRGERDHSAGHGAEGARDPERAGRSEAVDERAAHGPGDVGELGLRRPHVTCRRASPSEGGR
jgi:hypothetical protein